MNTQSPPLCYVGLVFCWRGSAELPGLVPSIEILMMAWEQRRSGKPVRLFFGLN